MTPRQRHCACPGPGYIPPRARATSLAAAILSDLVGSGRRGSNGWQFPADTPPSAPRNNPSRMLRAQHVSHSPPWQQRTFPRQYQPSPMRATNPGPMEGGTDMTLAPELPPYVSSGTMTLPRDVYRRGRHICRSKRLIPSRPNPGEYCEISLAFFLSP